MATTVNGTSLSKTEPIKDSGESDERKRSSTPSRDSNETPPKKVRKKSEPKIIDNMKEYLDGDALDKLTTTTLRHWLKQHQVHCTTREKKEDLLRKVRKHFEKNED